MTTLILLIVKFCYAGVRTVADLRAPALALGGIALSGPFLRAVS